MRSMFWQRLGIAVFLIAGLAAGFRSLVGVLGGDPMIYLIAYGVMTTGGAIGLILIKTALKKSFAAKKHNVWLTLVPLALLFVDVEGWMVSPAIGMLSLYFFYLAYRTARPSLLG